MKLVLEILTVILAVNAKSAIEPYSNQNFVTCSLNGDKYLCYQRGVKYIIKNSRDIMGEDLYKIINLAYKKSNAGTKKGRRNIICSPMNETENGPKISLKCDEIMDGNSARSTFEIIVDKNRQVVGSKRMKRVKRSNEYDVQNLKSGIDVDNKEILPNKLRPRWARIARLMAAARKKCQENPKCSECPSKCPPKPKPTTCKPATTPKQGTICRRADSDELEEPYRKKRLDSQKNKIIIDRKMLRQILEKLSEKR